MPEFSPETQHIAHAVMTNNTPKAWTYNSELYLVKADTKYTSSGAIAFTLAAGASHPIDFPVIMPDIEDTYQVYLDIYVEGVFLRGYQAIEDVVVTPAIATLYGTVVDAETGYAIAGVLVEVVGTGLSTYTDPSGIYEILYIPVGTYSIRFSHIDYDTLVV